MADNAKRIATVGAALTGGVALLGAKTAKFLTPAVAQGTGAAAGGAAVVGGAVIMQQTGGAHGSNMMKNGADLARFSGRSFKERYNPFGKKTTEK